MLIDQWETPSVQNYYLREYLKTPWLKPLLNRYIPGIIQKISPDGNIPYQALVLGPGKRTELSTLRTLECLSSSSCQMIAVEHEIKDEFRQYASRIDVELIGGFVLWSSKYS